MIKDKNRKGYIGASDTSYVMGNWESKSFKKWWKIKQGIIEDNYTNINMEAGSKYEHLIADALSLNGEKDTQFINEELKLRVNFDFETKDTIYEIKTYNIKNNFKVSGKYYMQCQVEMFARGWKKNLIIVSYALKEEDYYGIPKPIDLKRLSFYPVKPDKKFIEREYLPRLKILSSQISLWENKQKDK